MADLGFTHVFRSPTHPDAPTLAGPDTAAIKAAVEKAGYDVESITETR